MNRALRAATMGVLFLSPVVLSACSAGQVTQTASQERDKTGAQGQVGEISVRQAELVNPRSGSYERGDDAELQVALVNGGTEADTLVGVDGEGFGSAEIESSGTGTSTGSRGSDGEIEIPAGTSVFVGSDEFTVTLTDLDEDLTSGQYIEVTFTFENAGEITLPLTVATSSEDGTRGEAFDFHEEERTAEEG
ncbi:copper chaperone PCu(A)C [Blastococcus sp. CT_GayMR16]|uniref:copper chaperone PCu(A)C n=1 Tax=Blastococcus sp. CT_GayMR16 TaxID=2559607 RepID=UPI00107471AE|nr:copper chaperone PCu(A)C [Blastococcus sp. CT_GayMR16]TFV90590.1 copper chaperone PCu(A)C [Blastococcus sp. CT_GayMR16]